MYTIDTAEIRWFFKGHIPSELQSWLKRLDGTYEEQDSRTDSYLILPDYSRLGIKLREGRMEVKKMQVTGRSYSSGGINGTLEQWTKWSSSIEAAGNAYSLLQQDGSNWLRVQKSRAVQKYGITGSSGLTRFPDSGYPAAGIAVELSALIALEKSWWTFGIECFGEKNTVMTHLLALIPKLTTGIPLSLCRAENSAGYPEWITRLIKKP